MGKTIRIDRCQCKDLTFQQLLEEGAILQHDLEMIAMSTGASIECGTCRPWLEKALKELTPCFEVDSDSLENGEELLAHFGEGRCDEPES